jgi:hypothetical protein
MSQARLWRARSRRARLVDALAGRLLTVAADRRYTGGCSVGSFFEKGEI